MGRYITGDIETKLWFGVQSSNDADFFGVTGYQPESLEYFFERENLPDIKAGINKCIEALGDYKTKLDLIFSEANGYNDEMLMEKLSVSKDKVKQLLEWYARLLLGQKILECVEKTGQCSFTAEF